MRLIFLLLSTIKKNWCRKKKPLCKIIRLSADLTDPEWSSHLIKNGFSSEVPTFWVLEGLVYYIEREAVSSLLTKMAEISKIGSQIFIDIIHASRKTPFPFSQNESSKDHFSKHQKWDLNIKEAPVLIAATGWEVKSSLINENERDRNVGQKGMVFIQGIKE